MDQNPQPLEAVLRARRKNIRQFTVVLDAAGIDYEIRPDAAAFELLVSAEDAPRAREEIQEYMRENQAAPDSAAERTPSRTGWPGVVGYAAVLFLGFTLQRNFDDHWFHAGKTHAALIRSGELWRTVTALTLHSDIQHLIANIVAGGLIGLFVGDLLGSGLAWSSILLAGAAGNLLNALLRDPAHTSVGASTAVFAALGILAGHAWLNRAPTRSSRLARYAPIVGAIVLLSYLGTGGERTDVLAHVAGFVTGLFLGAAYGKLGPRIILGPRPQLLLALATMAFLTLAWLAALS